jgi:hypothetical protein
MPDPNVDFWEIVGRRIEFDELQVGETFILEVGRIRQVSRVVAKEEDGSFICQRADPADLPKNHKVLVMRRD